MLTFLSVIPGESLASEAESLNTIILINGEAVLVKIDQKGEILKKYINVPEYFTSSRSHESLVQRALGKVKGLSSVHRVYDEDHHFMSTKALAQHSNIIDKEKEWCASVLLNPSPCTQILTGLESPYSITTDIWPNLSDLYYRPTNRIRPSFSRTKVS